MTPTGRLPVGRRSQPPDRPTRDELLLERDLGLRCVVDRLTEQRDEIATFERRLVAAKKRRNTLIAKLRHGGLTVRFIAPVAGVTNERVTQIGQAGGIQE